MYNTKKAHKDASYIQLSNLRRAAASTNPATAARAILVIQYLLVRTKPIDSGKEDETQDKEEENIVL